MGLPPFFTTSSLEIPQDLKHVVASVLMTSNTSPWGQHRQVPTARPDGWSLAAGSRRNWCPREPFPPSAWGTKEEE